MLPTLFLHTASNKSSCSVVVVVALAWGDKTVDGTFKSENSLLKVVYLFTSPAAIHLHRSLLGVSAPPYFNNALSTHTVLSVLLETEKEPASLRDRSPNEWVCVFQSWEWRGEAVNILAPEAGREEGSPCLCAVFKLFVRFGGALCVCIHVWGTGRGHAKWEKSEAGVRGVQTVEEWEREGGGGEKENYSEGKEPCKWMLSSVGSGYAKWETTPRALHQGSPSSER